MNSERFSSWPWSRPFLLVALFALRSALLPAQTNCSNLGSTPVAATVEAAPIALGCSGAANWPCWHLFTPAHRAPAPHAGFDPGNAMPRLRVIVVYRCTGFLLLPVVPVHVQTMGYVIDQPEIACAG